MGCILPKMPLFLAPGGCVLVPLEATYEIAWEAVPRRWRDVLSPEKDYTGPDASAAFKGRLTEDGTKMAKIATLCACATFVMTTRGTPRSGMASVAIARRGTRSSIPVGLPIPNVSIVLTPG